MSWSLSKIVGLIIIPLMLAATILGAYQSIKTGPFENNKQKTLQILRKESRHMKIGVNPQGHTVDTQVAAEQFRGLVIYSQISAVNCKLLYYIHAKSADGSGDKLSKYVSGNSLPSEIPKDLSKADHMIKYSTPGRPSGPNGPGGRDHSLFNYLAYSDYVPTCIGTGNKIPSVVMDKRVQAMRKGDFIGTAFQATVGTVLGGLDDAWNDLTCKIAPGWAKERGNDMEGKFGKITFNTKKQLIIRNNKVWGVNALWDESNCDAADNENFYGPGFWAGGEWMNYVPYPAGSTTPKDMNYQINGKGVPFGETKSASMDAIIDAPITLNKDMSELRSHRGGDRFPVGQVNYVVCKGAEGYVQTNAQNMTNTGESIWGSSPYNNAGEYKGFSTKTFTFIHVTKGRKSCFRNTFKEGSGADYLGTTLHGKSCSTFKDATKKDPKVEDGKVCGLLRDAWHTDSVGGGKLLAHVWQIGWIDP